MALRGRASSPTSTSSLGSARSALVALALQPRLRVVCRRGPALASFGSAPPRGRRRRLRRDGGRRPPPDRLPLLARRPPARRLATHPGGTRTASSRSSSLRSRSAAGPSASPSGRSRLFSGPWSHGTSCCSWPRRRGRPPHVRLAPRTRAHARARSSSAGSRSPSPRTGSSRAPAICSAGSRSSFRSPPRSRAGARGTDTEACACVGSPRGRRARVVPALRPAPPRPWDAPVRRGLRRRALPPAARRLGGRRRRRHRCGRARPPLHGRRRLEACGAAIPLECGCLLGGGARLPEPFPHRPERGARLSRLADPRARCRRAGGAPASPSWPRDPARARGGRSHPDRLRNEPAALRSASIDRAAAPERPRPRAVHADRGPGVGGARGLRARGAPRARLEATSFGRCELPFCSWPPISR